MCKVLQGRQEIVKCAVQRSGGVHAPRAAQRVAGPGDGQSGGLSQLSQALPSSDGSSSEWYGNTCGPSSAQPPLTNHPLGRRCRHRGDGRAAQRTSQFTVAEGWLRGPLWLSYGMQLLLGRWAIAQEVSGQDVEDDLAARREAPAGQE